MSESKWKKRDTIAHLFNAFPFFPPSFPPSLLPSFFPSSLTACGSTTWSASGSGLVSTPRGAMEEEMPLEGKGGGEGREASREGGKRKKRTVMRL